MAWVAWVKILVWFKKKGVGGVGRTFVKKILLKISQNLKEGLKACNFIKKETRAQVFSCEFCEIFRNTYFVERLSFFG